MEDKGVVLAAPGSMVEVPIELLDKRKVAEKLAETRELRTREEYLWAAEMARFVADGERETVEFWAGPKKTLFEAHRKICADEAEWLRPYRTAKERLRQRLLEWDNAERRRMAEERAKREAEAKKLLEESALAEAIALEASGQAAEAEVVLAEAANTAIAVVSERPVKAPGIARREQWAYEVTDPTQHKRAYLILDEKEAGAAVRRLGPAAEQVVGGIRVFKKASVVIR